VSDDGPCEAGRGAVGLPRPARFFCTFAVRDACLPSACKSKIRWRRAGERANARARILHGEGDRFTNLARLSLAAKIARARLGGNKAQARPTGPDARTEGDAGPEGSGQKNQIPREWGRPLGPARGKDARGRPRPVAREEGDGASFSFQKRVRGSEAAQKEKKTRTPCATVARKKRIKRRTKVLAFILQTWVSRGAVLLDEGLSRPRPRRRRLANRCRKSTQNRQKNGHISGQRNSILFWWTWGSVKMWKKNLRNSVRRKFPPFEKKFAMEKKALLRYRRNARKKIVEINNFGTFQIVESSTFLFLVCNCLQDTLITHVKMKWDLHFDKFTKMKNEENEAESPGAKWKNNNNNGLLDANHYVRLKKTVEKASLLWRTTLSPRCWWVQQLFISYCSKRTFEKWRLSSINNGLQRKKLIFSHVKASENHVC